MRDIAEGFDKLLRQRAGLADDAPFDVMVHSTGMLVLRAWLTRRGAAERRLARVKHVIALAPATFGSPLAHKGRSFLGALVKGRKAFGPDFLEAGDQVLDALELGGRFTWQLARCRPVRHAVVLRQLADHALCVRVLRHARISRAGRDHQFARHRRHRAVGRLRVEQPQAGARSVGRVRRGVARAGGRLDAGRRPAASDRRRGPRLDHVGATGGAGATGGRGAGRAITRRVPGLECRGPAGWCARRCDALVPWQQFVVRAVDERGDPVPRLESAAGTRPTARPSSRSRRTCTCIVAIRATAAFT